MGPALFTFIPLILVRLMLKHSPPAEVEPWAEAATFIWTWGVGVSTVFAVAFPKFHKNNVYWGLFLVFELILLAGCIVLVSTGTTFLVPRQHPDPTWWKYLLAAVVLVYFRIALWVTAGITAFALRKRFDISACKSFCKNTEDNREDRLTRLKSRSESSLLRA